MLDHQLKSQRSKQQRFLVKSKTISLSKPKSKSIFSVENQNQTKYFEQISKDQSQVNVYQICGDLQFKKNYLKNISTPQKKDPRQEDQEDKKFLINDQNSRTQDKRISSFLDKKQKQSIYMNSIHNNNFLTKLSKTQKNTLNRQSSSIQKYSEVKNKWQKIDRYLKLRIPKSQTVTFGSVNKIYIHENPQKMQLINDMLPQYWRNSLRNNDKKLKSYLKGHDFKHQKAEQMLQTLKGIKEIQKSIPKINSQRIQKVFDKNKSFNLKANKLKISDGSQTMRQYHKSLHQTLNQTLKERSLRTSTHRRFSQRNRVTMTDKLEQPTYLQKMKQDQKRAYYFCKDLENLDRIDQQIYKKNYDKKSKWILEGLQVFS